VEQQVLMPMEILEQRLQFQAREDQLHQTRDWVEQEGEARPVQVVQVVLTMEVTGDLLQVTVLEEEEEQGMPLLPVQVMAVMAVILPQAQQVRVHYLVVPVAQTELEMELEMLVLLQVVVVVAVVSLVSMVLKPEELVLQEKL
jgi:hypothetical protein